MREKLRTRIFSITDDVDFDNFALEIFHFQYNHNPVYQKYCQTLYPNNKVINPESIHDIPFLPVSLFKKHSIKTGNWTPQEIFQSSSTGGLPSMHYVHEIQLYKESYSRCFNSFYHHPNHYAILGLMPSYLEREGSSLITMIADLIHDSSCADSGFFLYNYENLAQTLIRRELQNKKSLLFGVTFALIDFANHYKLNLPNTIIIETGGMKGRGKELIREEVHAHLKKNLSVSEIHSEYGMTELLSQAYMTQKSRFKCPPWLRPLIRDQQDPLCVKNRGKGLLNFIDLANIDTCSFIATDDIGEVFGLNEFSAYGRADFTELRGCNLMVSNFFYT